MPNITWRRSTTEPSTFPRRVAVIGAGPAGLMAAEVLARGGAAVTIYDRMPSAGRKFLLAGRGGLNLTHSEDFERLLSRYGVAAPHLRGAIAQFPPADLRAWSEGLGQPSFVGTSGRVFPAALKASPLLRAWLQRLDAGGVVFKGRHLWSGWDAGGALVFKDPNGHVVVEADATMLALGGASWPRLGSDGGWADVLSAAGIAVTPLAPANCGFTVAWSEIFRNRFEGQPLKRIALSFDDAAVRGEALITRAGLEGGAIYALSARLREAIVAGRPVILHIDLRPDITTAALAERLDAPRGKQSLSNHLRKAVSLAPAAIGLLNEAAISSGEPLGRTNATALATMIKHVPVRLVAPMPIENAISTAGGIAFDEVDAQFMLHKRPSVFVAGEMLDWEAPTGGYLLQACFATGFAAGNGALQRLRGAPQRS